MCACAYVYASLAHYLALYLARSLPCHYAVDKALMMFKIFSLVSNYI